jgi:F-type H+-transporting ATPase subunit delta
VKRRRAAKAYAKALFALAKERDQMELVDRELGDVTAIFGTPELRGLFARPWIPAATKRAVAMEAAQGFSKLTRDFVALVAERDRTDHLAVIATKYRTLVDEDLHRVRAHLRTAVPLTIDARGRLAAKLEQALGGRQVLLEEAVDRTMLAGFIMESAGVVLDGSLEGQLERMRRRLGQDRA